MATLSPSWVRRIMKRAAKPAAMALIAGGLSLSLVVTTPSNAHALVESLAVPVLFGAARMAIPALMPAAAILGPVGWGLLGVAAVAAIGVALYETRETWVPWVAGAFGAPTTNTPSNQGGTSANGYGTILAPFTLGAATVTGSVVNFASTYACPTSCTVNLHIAVRWECTRTGGTKTIKTAILNHSNVDVTAANTALPSVGVTCISTVGGITYNDIPTGGEYGLAGDGLLPLKQSTDKPFGPNNHRYFGNMGVGGFDPHGADVHYQTQLECISSEGALSTLTRDWLGTSPGLVIPSCEAAGKGHGTGKIKVVGFAPGSTNPQTLWDVAAPSQNPAENPLCSPSRPSSGCKLAVKIDGKECVVGLWECEHWSELNQDPNWEPRIDCSYGPYVVTAGTCNPLERAYEPGGSPMTDANTDGNPSTRSDTNLSGEPIPKTDGPAVGLVPGTAGQNSPDASAEEGECFPSGWAMFNPVEWVMKPVGCALKVAFVPDPVTVQTQTATIQQKFEDVGFSRITTAWLSTFEAAGGGSGCSGPTVQFQMSGVHQTLQPFNACSAPMSTVAGVSFAVSSIAIVLFGGLGIARAIAAGFGFNFTMGKGSDI